MKLGIVGLPNVGKSTLFNSLTKAGAESANYPFCTIDPNVGVVTVPDERLALLGDFYHSKKVLPAVDRHIDHQAQGVPPLGRNLHETASFSVPSILPQALPECKSPPGLSPPRRHRKLTTVRFSRTIKTTFERYGEEYRSWITQRNPCACIPSGGASWR